MPDSPSAVGVLGTRHIAGHLVERLARNPRRKVVLSPRNGQHARTFADQNTNVSVARDDAALVSEVDVVLLATRASTGADAIEGLPWHPAHTLVSLCAGLPMDALMFNAGAATLARAMPISAAAIGESPTCLYPDVAAAREVVEEFGPVHVLADEAQFDIATVSAAFYGWVHSLIEEMAVWSANQGLPPGTARALVSQTVRAAAGMVIAQPERSLPELLEELCAPGGITELGLQTLQDVRAFEYWQRASQAVLDELRSAGDV
ncbi:MAG: NAD(P)-binding domain-containing protein [Gammaproteobacteria bacterium]|nr:NAD(P)-binding domain-containing protein [Gammaproteobacteria bacterium]